MLSGSFSVSFDLSVDHTSFSELFYQVRIKGGHQLEQQSRKYRFHTNLNLENSFADKRVDFLFKCTYHCHTVWHIDSPSLGRNYALGPRCAFIDNTRWFFTTDNIRLQFTHNADVFSFSSRLLYHCCINADFRSGTILNIKSKFLTLFCCRSWK